MMCCTYRNYTTTRFPQIATSFWNLKQSFWVCRGLLHISKLWIPIVFITQHSIWKAQHVVLAAPFWHLWWTRCILQHLKMQNVILYYFKGHQGGASRGIRGHQPPKTPRLRGISLMVHFSKTPFLRGIRPGELGLFKILKGHPHLNKF